MHSGISCGKIFVTWMVVIVMFVLNEKFGDVGLLVAVGPVAIAQRMRLPHDKALAARLWENRLWKGFTVTYYLVLLVVAIVAAMRNVRLAHLPTLYFAVMLVFPILAPAMVNDIRTCLDRMRRE